MIQIGAIKPSDGPRSWFELLIPMRTKTGLNSREHWAQRARRVKRERQAVLLVWQSARPRPLEPPFVVTLTRVGPRRCDSDGAVGGLKAVRDQVAEQLGVDDGDERAAVWCYRQQLGAYAVHIRVEGRAEAPF